MKTIMLQITIALTALGATWHKLTAFRAAMTDTGSSLSLLFRVTTP